MEIQWFSKNINGVVSIYETNITLNTVASIHFEGAYKTIIGFNKVDSTLIIKKLTKEEVMSGAYNNFDLHDVSIKPSYGRINGKDLIKNIIKHFPLDFTNTTLHKFNCSWDDTTKSLTIYLKGGVI